VQPSSPRSSKAELRQADFDPPLAQLRARGLEHQRLRDVDGGQTAADHEGPVLRLVHRAVVVGFFRVIEPDDEGVLVDEPLADVVVGALDGHRPVAPGAAGEHDAGEAPGLDELAEVHVPPDARQGHEVDARTPEVLADRRVLLLAQVDVPARESVLDLPVGTRVLLEDDHLGAALGEGRGDLRARHGAANDGHTV
jgi:hypothetical protein